MQIGKLSINVEALADISKDEFKEIVKGKISIDFNDAWKMFSKEARQYQKELPVKKVKRFKD